MINKIYNKIKNKFFLATVYEKIFIFGINKFIGDLSLIFFKFIYAKNFKIGQDAQCWGSISLRISQNAEVKIGKNCTIVSNNNRAGITVFTKFKITALFGSKIYIGENVSFNGTSLSCRTSSISIGSGTIIGPNVVIVDSDFHGIYPAINRENNLDYASDRPVKIDDNVWLGMNTVILKGVNIGENSVIAAGSIVKNDIPSNCLAAGNPAKKIKDLN